MLAHISADDEVKKKSKPVLYPPGAGFTILDMASICVRVIGVSTDGSIMS